MTLAGVIEEVHATVAGVDVFWSDLASSAGYVHGEGYRFEDPTTRMWTNKTDALKAARAIDWPVNAVLSGKYLSRFIGLKVWALHCPGGGWLTEDGYARILGLTHLTTTFERPGEMRIRSKSNGRTFMKRDTYSGWRCSCGEHGFGDSREHARSRASSHRNAPPTPSPLPAPVDPDAPVVSRACGLTEETP